MLCSLKLAWCNLQKFANLQKNSSLQVLDLSGNNIHGEIPSWIWGVGNGSLYYMNLSHNFLTALQKPYRFPPDLEYLDLHSNRFSGVIPVPPKTALFIDYSHNLFNSSLPEPIGTSLQNAYLFSVSNNSVNGVIPKTICKATALEVLDLSNNRLTGRIPQCLIESDGSLVVLNLGNNSLSGRIEGTFPRTCGLETLDVNGNSLEGKIPPSLVNCTWLEVLNLGNNMINDTFPCFLGSNTNLRVLVLRSNMFHGTLHCGKGQQHNLSTIQIVDMAHNSFSGIVPPDYFSSWNAMMTGMDGEQSDTIRYEDLYDRNIYYQDTVTITIKGKDLELVKIMKIFTSIDISSNHFSGKVPHTIGLLNALHLLNVSHNYFTGSIPPSLGNLSRIESLDLSSNKLLGGIPPVLTNLPFLSVLNLSYNQLEGKIPTGNQFQTFDNNSYKGNKGLCGFPLSRTCTSAGVPGTSSVTNSKESSDEKDWQSVFYGMGAGAGLLILISLLCSIRRRPSSPTNRHTNVST